VGRTGENKINKKTTLETQLLRIKNSLKEKREEQNIIDWIKTIIYGRKYL